MTIRKVEIILPKLIDTYIKAQNAYDADTALACFSENATVHDEGETLKGKKAIREWMEKTKKKYSPHCRPVGIKETKKEPRHGGRGGSQQHQGAPSNQS